jgi:hypothetical protein
VKRAYVKVAARSHFVAVNAGPQRLRETPQTEWPDIVRR